MDDAQNRDQRGCPPGAGTFVRENGSRIGNPPFVPTDAQRAEVRTLSKVANQTVIAQVLGISVDTLQRHFREELDYGAAQAIVAVGSILLQKALGGHGPSINFYLATRGKGSYSRRVELTGPEGGPMRTYNTAGLSPELKRMLLAEVEGMIAEHGGDAADEGGANVSAYE